MTYLIVIAFLGYSVVVWLLNLHYSHWVPDWVFWALPIGFPAIIIALVPALMLSRSMHGRELALASMECQVNVQSTPDGNAMTESSRDGLSPNAEKKFP
jgi:hypothetical protein